MVVFPTLLNERFQRVVEFRCHVHLGLDIRTPHWASEACPFNFDQRDRVLLSETQSFEEPDSLT